MKLWKCYNCQHQGVPGVDFFGDEPVCPTCKLDGRDPRFGGRIAQCKVIHFDPPHPVVAGAGEGHLACDPTKKIGEVSAMATGVPDVVNCPLCRATEAWEGAKTKAEEGPDNLKGVPAGLASEILGGK